MIHDTQESVRLVDSFFCFAEGYRMSQQKPAAIGSKTKAARDSCQKGHDRGLNRILEENRTIELAAAQGKRKSQHTEDTSMFAALVIDNDLITTGMIFQQLGNQGIGHHGDMCLGISFPDRYQRRQGHDSIADPVGSPYNDATDFFWFETFQSEWITDSNSFDLGQRKGFVNQHDRNPVPNWKG